MLYDDTTPDIQLGNGVTARFCPVRFTGYEWWYIRREPTPVQREIGIHGDYWTERGWDCSTPIQFSTAQEAIDYHKAHADKINA